MRLLLGTAAVMSAWFLGVVCAVFAFYDDIDRSEWRPFWTRLRVGTAVMVAMLATYLTAIPTILFAWGVLK